MNILSRFVIEKIEQGDPTWRDLVPEPVATYITENNLWSVNDAEKAAKG